MNNPLSAPITFVKLKQNHFYAIKKGDTYLKVDPKKGDKVYEIPTISGGAVSPPLLLQIPIPLCVKHQHDGKPFGIKICNDWEYIAIPTPLGSLRCRECFDELFVPQPYLRSADLSSTNLRSANLSSANLSSADLSSADLSSANLSYANLHCANLSSANLRSADLSYANLSYADLSYADLSSANLRYANLRYANLSYANLRSADLHCVNLRSADLSSANLSYADLSSANLSYVGNMDKSFNFDQSYWNRFTIINEKSKKLLSKGRFLK